VLKLLRPNEPLFITEGASDCWAMLSSGHKAIAIPSATLLKEEDLEPLIALSSKLGTTFHMYPDNDAPGQRLYLELRDRLGSPSPLNPHPSPFIHHQLPEQFKDYGEYYVQRWR